MTGPADDGFACLSTVTFSSLKSEQQTSGDGLDLEDNAANVYRWVHSLLLAVLCPLIILTHLILTTTLRTVTIIISIFQMRKPGPGS